jgi:hypothetical protein
VSGVTVTFESSTGSAPTADNRVRIDGGAFQNFAGMQALNVNSGAAASQNAATNVAVSTRDVTPR